MTTSRENALGTASDFQASLHQALDSKSALEMLVVSKDLEIKQLVSQLQERESASTTCKKEHGEAKAALEKVLLETQAALKSAQSEIVAKSALLKKATEMETELHESIATLQEQLTTAEAACENSAVRSFLLCISFLGCFSTREGGCRGDSQTRSH